MAKTTGNFGYVDLDGVILHVTDHTIDDNVDIEDSTTTESAGNQEVEPVLSRLDVSFSAFWDPGASPSAASPGIVGGKKITAAKFYIGNPANNKYYSAPFVIKNVKIDNKVKGLVKYNVEATSNGVISRPT